MRGELKKWHELQDGAVFWCNPDLELNSGYSIGDDWVVAGKDQIFIKDDFVDLHDDNSGSLLVNGGHVVEFLPDDVVYEIGHYGELISNIENELEKI